VAVGSPEHGRLRKSGLDIGRRELDKIPLLDSAVVAIELVIGGGGTEGGGAAPTDTINPDLCRRDALD
jgi:hypothetical protein